MPEAEYTATVDTAPFQNLEAPVGRTVKKVDIKEVSGNDLARKLNTSTFSALEDALVRQTGKDRSSVEVEVSQAVQTIMSDVNEVFDAAKSSGPRDQLLRRVDHTSENARTWIMTEPIYYSLKENDPSLTPEENALALQYLALRLVEPQQSMKPIDRRNSRIIGAEDSSKKPQSHMEQVYKANRAKVQAKVAENFPNRDINTYGKVGNRISAVEDIVDGMVAGPSPYHQIVLDEVGKRELIEMHGTGNFPGGVKPQPVPIIDTRPFHTVSHYLNQHPQQYRESQRAIQSLQRVMGVEKPDLRQYSRYNTKNPSAAA